MRKRKFGLTAVCCGVILTAFTATGTVLAWLTDFAEPVKNTFAVGRVNLRLTETWNSDSDGDGTADSWAGALIPGTQLHKDPVVSVRQGSEDCWLFVKVTEENWPETTEADGITPKITYDIAKGWSPLSEEDDVFYRKSVSTEESRRYSVLDGDRIRLSQTLPKQEIAAVSDMKLSLTAWAIQYAGLDTPESAWNRLNS